MMNELKPCPFCGHKVKVEIDEINSRTGSGDQIFVVWEIKCHECGCRKADCGNYTVSPDLVLKAVDEKDPLERVVEMWNTRSE